MASLLWLSGQGTSTYMEDRISVLVSETETIYHAQGKRLRGLVDNLGEVTAESNSVFPVSLVWYALGELKLTEPLRHRVRAFSLGVKEFRAPKGYGFGRWQGCGIIDLTVDLD